MAKTTNSTNNAANTKAKATPNFDELVVRRDDGSIRPMIEQAERVFNVLNLYFFNGELSRPTITISPDTTRRGAYGWVTTKRVWKTERAENGNKVDENNGYYELNLTAEYLDRGFIPACATILHEMCHIFALQNDIKDTSRSGSFHNAKYKEIAESHGLNVVKEGGSGWCRTSLKDDIKSELEQIETEEVWNMYRLPKVKSVKSASSSIKYVCRCCGATIRATKDMDGKLLCTDCNEFFVRGR